MADSMAKVFKRAVDGGALPIRNTVAEFTFVRHQGRLATEMGHV